MLFRKTRASLQGITRPEQVRLEGRVASPDELESPMGGGRAALFQVVVGVRYVRARGMAAGQWNEEQVTVFDRLGSEVFGDHLLIEAPGGLLAVPRGARLEFPSVESLAVLPVSAPLPGRLADVQNLPAAGKGVLCYQALSLSQGDPVRFEGWVVPLRQTDAYREAASPDSMLARAGVTHVAELERGSAVVRDMTTEGTEFGRSGVMKLVSWILGGGR